MKETGPANIISCFIIIIILDSYSGNKTEQPGKYIVKNRILYTEVQQT